MLPSVNRLNIYVHSAYVLIILYTYMLCLINAHLIVIKMELPNHSINYHDYTVILLLLYGQCVCVYVCMPMRANENKSNANNLMEPIFSSFICIGENERSKLVVLFINI